MGARGGESGTGFLGCLDACRCRSCLDGERSRLVQASGEGERERTVLVVVQHAVVELDAETSFDLVLDLAQQRRILVAHLHKLARVLDHQRRISRKRCDREVLSKLRREERGAGISPAILRDCVISFPYIFSLGLYPVYSISSRSTLSAWAFLTPLDPH